ncbi:MAG: DUF2007 domain-containing protein [Gammaproteobacteria bacterium]|nr:DUF2007 domain-containing protein [Gammaproteobacteria bacterium]
MIKVYDAAHLIDAQRVCDQLRAGGIRAEIRGGLLTGGLGELGVESLVSVWICEERHYSRARELIHELEKDLRTPSVTLFCPGCQEPVEGHFSHCWNCNARLPHN